MKAQYKKYCQGCRNNFYNGNNQYGVKECWSFKEAKIVWRVPVGNWEKPPYKMKKVRVPTCKHSESCGTHWINPDNLTKQGYWR